METIKTYLDNMFSGLPKTVQMADLKNNILANMEEKYNELKTEGKSENEAIGIVISEFGNIDELIGELGIKVEEEVNYQPLVSQEEADSYLKAKKRNGLFVGVGAVLCILGAASLILVDHLVQEGYIATSLSGDAKDIFGLIPLFLLVATAVGLFIYTGNTMEKYRYLEQGIQLPSGIKLRLQQMYDSFQPIYNVSLIIGVILCILSPISLFITSAINENTEDYGIVILLVIVSIAVFLFIYFGSLKESYCRLLGIGEYSKKQLDKKAKDDKVIGIVASIVWPLAAAVFLLISFVYNLWYISWVIFPITGILFGIFCSVYSSLNDKSNA